MDNDVVIANRQLFIVLFIAVIYIIKSIISKVIALCLSNDFGRKQKIWFSNVIGQMKKRREFVAKNMLFSIIG
jgi:hypothetical protein